MPEVSSKKPVAVGAYIFAGGFTLGVSKHFNIACHLEESEYGVRTCQRNFPQLLICIGPETWPLEALSEYEIDFVYGNPPCAAWSVAGYTKTRGTDKWKTDPRVACTQKHFGLLGALEPKIWAWESVTQAFTKGREFVKTLTREAAEAGYSTSYLLHDSQWYGLPQVRKRFFMVCHKIEFNPIMRAWKNPPTPVEVLKPAKHDGVHCAIGRSEAKWSAERLAKVKPGERLAKHWEEHYAPKGPIETWERNENGGIKGRPSFGHFRLPTDRPGGAVVGYVIIHPTEHRFLCTEEVQVLSGFPPDYIFTPGGTTARLAEIARGVCPPVGEWLGWLAANAIKRDVPIKVPTVKLYDFRKPDQPIIDMTDEILGAKKCLA